jgi:hypothetical protein
MSASVVTTGWVGDLLPWVLDVRPGPMTAPYDLFNGGAARAQEAAERAWQARCRADELSQWRPGSDGFGVEHVAVARLRAHEARIRAGRALEAAARLDELVAARHRARGNIAAAELNEVPQGSRGVVC